MSDLFGLPKKQLNASNHIFRCLTAFRVWTICGLSVGETVTYVSGRSEERAAAMPRKWIMRWVATCIGGVVVGGVVDGGMNRGSAVRTPVIETAAYFVLIAGRERAHFRAGCSSTSLGGARLSGQGHEMLRHGPANLKSRSPLPSIAAGQSWPPATRVASSWSGTSPWEMAKVSLSRATKKRCAAWRSARMEISCFQGATMARRLPGTLKAAGRSRKWWAVAVRYWPLQSVHGIRPALRWGEATAKSRFGRLDRSLANRCIDGFR